MATGPDDEVAWLILPFRRGVVIMWSVLGQAKMAEINPRDEVWSDLIVSILSVNNYSLEKAYSLVPALRSEGLCSPDNLVKWDVEAIAKRLKNAGLERGSFMAALYAQRLSSLGAAINRVGVADFTNALSSERRADISTLLTPIHGIGPRVLANFFESLDCLRMTGAGYSRADLKPATMPRAPAPRRSPAALWWPCITR
jgi:hypothetical protein